jgi:hypothetical protein
VVPVAAARKEILTVVQVLLDRVIMAVAHGTLLVQAEAVQVQPERSAHEVQR